jgi:ketosteroid isomerase-like protein
MIAAVSLEERAQRFFDAVEAGDIDTAIGMLSPGVKVWHNTDEVVVTRNSTRKTLLGMHKAISNVKYEKRQVRTWPGGFLEQHILTGSRKADGGKVRLPACVICEVNEDGKITKLDEYFDSSAQNEFGRGMERAKI